MDFRGGLGEGSFSRGTLLVEGCKVLEVEAEVEVEVEGGCAGLELRSEGVENARTKL